MFSDNFFLFSVQDFSSSLLRYFLLSIIPYLLLFKLAPKYFSQFKVSKSPKNVAKIELLYSLLSLVTYCFADYFLLVTMKTWNISKIYQTFGTHGLAYEALTFIILFVAQDVSFYFIHRILHLKWFYKHIHKIHHLSKHSTPLAAYSFHPVEAVSMSLFFIILVCFLPVNIYTAGAYFFFSHVFNAYGHSGHDFHYEPNSFYAQWIHGAKRHDDHHSKNNGNYGLYTNIWDKIFNTLDKR